MVLAVDEGAAAISGALVEKLRVFGASLKRGDAGGVGDEGVCEGGAIDVAAGWIALEGAGHGVLETGTEI